MKLGKITNKQVFMLVLAVGLVGCLIVYMQVFSKYRDKTSSLKKSNAELEKQVNELKEYYDNMEVYSALSAEMVAEIKELTADYPADAKEEDMVMMAVAIQNNAIVNFDKINVDETKVVHSIPEELVKGAGIEGLEEAIQFSGKMATYSNKTTYSYLKTAVKTVYESPYRIGVKTVAFRKSSETNNIIEGTIDLNYYSVSGMGKEYKAPEMPTYFGGASDLFGPLYFKEAVSDVVGEGAGAAVDVVE